MIKTHRLFLTLCLTTFISSSAFSEAPVVDDSENFAMLEEQQVELERPVARTENDLAYNDATPIDELQPEQSEPLIEEIPVAKANDFTRDDEEVPLAYDNNQALNGNNNALLLDRVQTLQQEVQELRGQLEVQAHDLKLLQQQQLAFYKDLDARISNNSAVVGKSPSTAIKTGQGEQLNPVTLASLTPTEKTNPANEQISYLAAYELVKNKKYDPALSAMQTFVYQYPQSGYAANAQYWLGELYLVKKKYPEAIEHFDAVLKKYPTSSKTPASMLKIGYALAASGKKEEARQHLQQVIKNYPDTNTAQLATAKLKSLGS